MVDLLRSDLRDALRGVWARPSLSAVIVLTLGLGLGANAAIFSAVNALLLRPFPFTEPDRLVRVSTVRGGEDGFLNVSGQDDIAGLSHIVEDIALYTDQGMYKASGFGAPEELPATIGSAMTYRIVPGTVRTSDSLVAGSSATGCGGTRAARGRQPATVAQRVENPPTWRLQVQNRYSSAINRLQVVELK